MEYYEHLCLCGCGGQIEVKKWHKWKGRIAPEYILGHNKGNLGKKNTEESKQKMREAKLGYIPWNKGKKLSPEHAEKARKANLGKKRTEEAKRKTSETLKENYRTGKMVSYLKGKIPWNKGKKLPELSEKYKGEGNPMYGRFGELSGNWQGGKSFEPYPSEFNKELKVYIKTRDLNICQTPGCMETENLDCHHIDYDKNNNDPKNIITLCDSCHGKTHFNRDYYSKFYSEIISIYL